VLGREKGENFKLGVGGSLPKKGRGGGQKLEASRRKKHLIRIKRAKERFIFRKREKSEKLASSLLKGFSPLKKKRGLVRAGREYTLLQEDGKPLQTKRGTAEGENSSRHAARGAIPSIFTAGGGRGRFFHRKRSQARKRHLKYSTSSRRGRKGNECPREKRPFHLNSLSIRGESFNLLNCTKGRRRKRGDGYCMLGERRGERKGSHSPKQRSVPLHKKKKKKGKRILQGGKKRVKTPINRQISRILLLEGKRIKSQKR